MAINNSGCEWDSTISEKKFAYSRTSTAVNWEDSESISADASVLAIFVKITHA